MTFVTSAVSIKPLSPAMSAHLPSPTSTASMSPRHTNKAHSSCSDDELEHDGVARSALEIRREKNRIKQRNLRLRRANQMADLESTVNSLRTKGHDLADRIADLEAHSASLTAWVRDLEGLAIQQGAGDKVDQLRRLWGDRRDVTTTHHRDCRDRERDRERDPLSTLASAASRHDLKRRREHDLPPIERLSPTMERFPSRQVSPNRNLSIAELMAPQPSRGWSYGPLPPIEVGYEPRKVPRSMSPNSPRHSKY